ncbi:Chromatin structure remodeling complex protein sfh1 [Puccinia graminis f. sp. tritici]|uniref:Chromatin structure remodeling complex protein sfh1 n=1 Tax=Puccinia graminis f. sp. tritici TaxID=56615 RepID=A0A5B0R9G4_PUCGR|nr:Chromatin structure remodeling complex protein sfh1 [Puccinia graminis f. sp. tritici]
MPGGLRLGVHRSSRWAWKTPSHPPLTPCSSPSFPVDHHHNQPLIKEPSCRSRMSYQPIIDPSSSRTPSNNRSHHQLSSPNHQSWPLIDQPSLEPAPPYHPLSSNSNLQASLTTFPSRLRLGTSALAQPIYTNTYIQNRLQRPNSPIDSHPSNPTTVPLSEPGKRARRVVNYSENEPSRLATIDPDLDPAFEDDHPRARAGSTRGRPSHGSRLSMNANVNQTPLGGQAGRLAARNSTPTPAPSEPGKTQEDDLAKRKYADGRSYLGQDPPAKWIQVERKTKRAPLLMNTLGLSEIDQASDSVCLVPIRIELDTDELRIRDVFTWNLRERYITPEIFSLEFCADAGIQSGVYVPKIVEQIKSQLNQYSFLSATKLVPDEADLSHFTDDQLVGIEPDLRVVIQLDVQIETLHLIDRIEWDLASPLTPELFTAQYICDLNLPRSASPIIAHAIHEEICRHKRDCLSLGLISQEVLSSSVVVPNDADPQTTTTTSTTPTPNPVGIVQTSFKIESDPLLKEKYGSSRGPKKLEGVWRDWHEANLFGPKLQLIHVEDLEWAEIEKERLARRSRRDTTRTARRR